MTTHRIAVIPGDGIGTEVMPEGVRVLEAVASRFGIRLALDPFGFACWPWYEKHGSMMPDDWALQNADDTDQHLISQNPFTSASNVGVGNGRRILAMVAAVMLGNLARQTVEFLFGFRRSELVDGLGTHARLRCFFSGCAASAIRRLCSSATLSSGRCSRWERSHRWPGCSSGRPCGNRLATARRAGPSPATP